MREFCEIFFEESNKTFINVFLVHVIGIYILDNLIQRNRVVREYFDRQRIDILHSRKAYLLIVVLVLLIYPCRRSLNSPRRKPINLLWIV